MRGRLLKVCTNELKQLFTTLDFDLNLKVFENKNCELNLDDFSTVESTKRWIFQVEKNTKNEEQYKPVETPRINETDLKQKIFKTFLEETIKNTSRGYSRPLFFEFTK